MNFNGVSPARPKRSVKRQNRICDVIHVDIHLKMMNDVDDVWAQITKSGPAKHVISGDTTAECGSTNSDGSLGTSFGSVHGPQLMSDSATDLFAVSPATSRSRQLLAEISACWRSSASIT